MASKTTNNTKLQEQQTKIAVQSQLARIKKEEEEELWISGEELYTEGSSDEEEFKTQSRSRCKINISNQSSRTSSASRSAERRNRLPIPEVKVRSDRSASKDKFLEYSSTENVHCSPSIQSIGTNRFAATESSVSSITKSFSNLSTEQTEENNDEISWKAKRGTFTLPNSSNDTKEETNKC